MEKVKPIILDATAVRGIVKGRKTLHCNIVKSPGITQRASPYQLGDVLWVREEWSFHSGHRFECDVKIHYSATDDYRSIHFKTRDEYDAFLSRWGDLRSHPGGHMSKGLARIFLHVSRVEEKRLHEVTEEEVIAFGLERLFDHLSEEQYASWAKRTNEPKAQTDWGWSNYLWHGHFGRYGTGGVLSDAWPYQRSAYENPIDSFSSRWNRRIPLKKWPQEGWDADPLVWITHLELCEAPEEWKKLYFVK